MRTARLALLALLLVGCPRRMESRVEGADEEQLTSDEARLEELRVRAALPEATCAEQCSLAPQVCDVAEALCTVVARHPERADLPPRCSRAREACAERTDTCARCRRRE
jgi:hypothetical protein